MVKAHYFTVDEVESIFYVAAVLAKNSANFPAILLILTIYNNR